MKSIRLGFCDTFEGCPEFFTHVLSRQFEVIRDDENPEYLIFGDMNFGQKNLKFDQYKVKKIFYTGENQRPNNYVCEFAIGFDHWTEEKYYRLPLGVLDIWMNWPNKDDPVSNFFDVEDIYTERMFCSFISGNPNSPMRNNLFHLINEYKEIHSYGPLFNNRGNLPRGKDAAHYKMSVMKDYKFNLCPENSSHSGYVTEKICHSFLAGSVPIYFGSPTVSIDFNSESFLDRANYFSDNNFMDALIKLDTDPDVYFRMLTSSKFTNIPDYWDLNRLCDWFKEIVIK